MKKPQILLNNLDFCEGNEAPLPDPALLLTPELGDQSEDSWQGRNVAGRT